MVLEPHNDSLNVPAGSPANTALWKPNPPADARPPSSSRPTRHRTIKENVQRTENARVPTRPVYMPPKASRPAFRERRLRPASVGPRVMAVPEKMSSTTRSRSAFSFSDGRCAGGADMLKEPHQAMRRTRSDNNLSAAPRSMLPCNLSAAWSKQDISLEPKLAKLVEGQPTRPWYQLGTRAL